MYRIDTEISEAHFKELCLDAGAVQSGVEKMAVSVSTSFGCKAPEMVLEVIPHLLDMLSEGKVTSIKITKL